VVDSIEDRAGLSTVEPSDHRMVYRSPQHSRDRRGQGHIRCREHHGDGTLALFGVAW